MLDKLLEKEITQKGLEAICRLEGRPRKDVADRRQAGLQLRISGDTVAWWFRTETGGVRRRVRLGVAPDLTVGNARAIAAAALDMIRRDAGEPDDRWVAAKRIEIGVDAAIEVKPTKSLSRWTFAQARDAYLVEVARTTRPATQTTYRHMLTHPSLSDLEGEEVSGLTRQRLATIIAGVHASGREPMAKSIADTVRTMWRYLERDDVIATSHVAVGEMDRLKAPPRSKVVLASARRQERTPSIDEIGYLLAIAQSGQLDRTIGPAIALLCLTAQRRFSIVLARREMLGESAGFFVWTLPPEDLKTGDKRQGSRGELIMPHELPLPSEAKATVEMAAELSDSEWLFPQVRPKKAGMAVGHIHQSSLTHAFQEMPGIDFSPHDIRRAFTTAIEGARKGKGRRFLEGEPAKILDHAEGRDHNDTTTRHYNRHRALQGKFEMLSWWQDALLPSTKRHLRETDWQEFDRQAVANRRFRRDKKNQGKPLPYT